MKFTSKNYFTIFITVISLLSYINIFASSFCQQWRPFIQKSVLPLIHGHKPTRKTDQQALGAIVMIEKLGRGSCTYTLGHGDLQGNPVNVDGVFELASVTKIFTTAILAKYVIQHKLNLNETVAPYLPHFFKLTPEERGVTFQQLATFTGGFNSNDPPGYVIGKPFSLKRFVGYVNQLKPSEPIAGRKYLPTYNLYSNSSVALLGMALMQFDDQQHKQKFQFTTNTFSHWIQSNLTNALHMSSKTAVWPTGPYLKGFAYSKSTKHYTLAQPFPWNFKGPAGLLRSNIKDMGQFLKACICAYYPYNAHCRAIPPTLLKALRLATTVQYYTPGGKLKNKTIYMLDSKTRQLYLTRDKQALAWSVSPPTKLKIIPHKTIIIWKGGGHTGFTTWLGFSPKKSFGVFIVTNSGGTNGIEPTGVALIQHAKGKTRSHSSTL